VTRVLGLVLGCALAVSISACTGSGHHKSSSVADAATVRTATCADWKQTSKDERAKLVGGLREFFGGQVDTPGVHGQVLPDSRAFELFDAYCKPSFATDFQLYRIYGNAAAFTVPLPTHSS